MENKPYRVIVSSQASEQLVSHAAFLANVSVDAAERLVQSFESAAASLSVAPLRRSFRWRLDGIDGEAAGLVRIAGRLA